MKFNLSKISSTINTAATGFSIGKLLSGNGGIDIKSLTPSSIGSMSSGMESKMEAMTKDMETKIQSGANEEEIASMVDNMTSEMNFDNMSINDADSYLGKLQGINFM